MDARRRRWNAILTWVVDRFRELLEGDLSDEALEAAIEEIEAEARRRAAQLDSTEDAEWLTAIALAVTRGKL